jgi:hypothetical protein
MQIPEGLEFKCGNCAWMQKVEVPKEKKKDYPIARGYCTFNPPAVFPMPQQQGSLADVQGQQRMGMAPFMMRPVVEENEPPCGRYAPDTETLDLIEGLQGGCPGKCKEGGCGSK